MLCIGAPFQYTESRILKARLEFLRENYRIKEQDFLSFDAMRHAAQCLGRVLRGKDDYGIMVLADRRFQKKRSQLPRWIADEISEGQTGLSTDAAVGLAKKFLRNIAQPLRPGQKLPDGSTKGKDSWSFEELEMFQAEQKARRGEGGGDFGREDAAMHDYMHSDVNRNGINGSAIVNGREVDMQDDEYGDGIEDADLIEAMEAEGRGGEIMVE